MLLLLLRWASARHLQQTAAACTQLYLDLRRSGLALALDLRQQLCGLCVIGWAARDTKFAAKVAARAAARANDLPMRRLHL